MKKKERKKESKSQLEARLHCSHVSFDELTNWYYELTQKNHRLEEALDSIKQELIESKNNEFLLKTKSWELTQKLNEK